MRLQIAFIFQGEELGTKQSRRRGASEAAGRILPTRSSHGTRLCLIGRDLAHVGSARAAPQRPRFAIWH